MMNDFDFKEHLLFAFGSFQVINILLGLAGISIILSINCFMVLNTSENVCTRHWQTSEAKASQTD